jgi:MoaD family protein
MNTRATMEITVHYLTVLRGITDKRQEKIQLREGSTLQDMLELLTKKYGDDFKRFAHSGRKKKGLQLVFLLDDEDAAQFSGLKTKLQDGVTVTLMPPIAGG